MTSTAFAAPLAPRTGKIINTASVFFERGENLLRNGIQHFVFKLNQSS